MIRQGSFDSAAFYHALDSERISRGITWKAVAEESGVSASTLSRMAQGRRPDVDGLASLLAWSGLEASRFVRVTGGPSEPTALAQVATYFRSDPNLTPEAARHLTALVQTAYTALRTNPQIPKDLQALTNIGV